MELSLLTNQQVVDTGYTDIELSVSTHQQKHLFRRHRCENKFRESPDRKRVTVVSKNIRTSHEKNFIHSP